MADCLVSLTWIDSRSSYCFCEDSRVAIRKVAGKGLGAVACTHIEAGDRLVAEPPLARLAQVAWKSRAEADGALSRVLGGLSLGARAEVSQLSH